MDGAGVAGAFALGFGWSDPALCAYHNDYLIDVQRRWPGRLCCFAALQPLQKASAVQEIQRVAMAGLRGIGELMPHGQGYDLADRQITKPLVEAARAYGLPILTHVSEPIGHLYPGKGNVSVAAAEAFVTQAAPLPVILAHWGGGLPFYELIPEVQQNLATACYDSAASPFLYSWDIFDIVARLAGPRRVLFGTDYPLLRQRPFLDQIRALPLAVDTLSRILGLNAVDLMARFGPWPAV